MRNLEFVFVLGFLVLCSCNSLNKKPQPNIRLEILGKNFSNDEIKSIEIVEIEHPLLGKIIETKKLNKEQKDKFLADFDSLKQKGMQKCRANYVVRLNFETDTLRLQVCGSMIANRSNDLYYSLSNEKSIIEDYIGQE